MPSSFRQASRESVALEALWPSLLDASELLELGSSQSSSRPFSHPLAFIPQPQVARCHLVHQRHPCRRIGTGPQGPLLLCGMITGSYSPRPSARRWTPERQARVPQDQRGGWPRHGMGASGSAAHLRLPDVSGRCAHRPLVLSAGRGPPSPAGRSRPRRADLPSPAPPQALCTESVVCLPFSRPSSDLQIRWFRVRPPGAYS